MRFGKSAFQACGRDAIEGAMDDLAMVQCPYCYEPLELYVDPGTSGSYVEDCAICCRPWRVFVSRDEEGRLGVQVERDQ